MGWIHSLLTLKLLIIYFSFSVINAQENPKNIITNENNTLIIEEDSESDLRYNSQTFTNESLNLKENIDKTNLENNVEQLDEKNSIIVQDIPNNYNLSHQYEYLYNSSS